jgi:hypothetical protein
MIKYLFVEFSIVALPLLIGLSIFAGHNNCAPSLPARWFAGLFFLITILTIAISLGFGFDVIFANSFEVTIASLVTSLVIVTMRLYGSSRLTAPSIFDTTWVRPVGPLYEAIRLSIVLLLLFYGFSEVLKVPVNEWDAVFIWFNKAKSIYYGELWNKIPAAEYPNSGPLIWAFLMRLFGQTEQIGRLIFPTIYVFCCWQFSYFHFKSHRRFLYFLICWAVLSFYLFKNWAWNGYQDNFIACTAAMAVYIFIRCLNMADPLNNACKNKEIDSLAFLFCGMLYLIKNEGLILGAIICLSYLIFSYKKMTTNELILKKLVINTVIFLIPIALQIFIKLGYGINPLQVQGDAFSLIPAFVTQERLMRLGPISWMIGTYIWHNLYIYFLCLLSTFYSIKYYINIENNLLVNGFLVVITLLHSLFIALVFIITNQNLEWHLMTAQHRLMSQHLMIVFALTLWNLAIIINNFKANATKTV